MRQARPPRRQEGGCQRFNSNYCAGPFVSGDALNAGLGGHRPIEGLVRLAFDRDAYDSSAVARLNRKVGVRPPDVG
jgi:hypothetical protein